MADLYERVLAATRDRADLLDSGVLAPPEVAAMSEAGYEAAWAEVFADHNTVTEHRPLEPGHSCGNDGQRYPCPRVRDVLTRYRVYDD